MAYTVLDSKNIDKKKNIYTFGGSGTKPERNDIAENSKLIDYSSGEKFYYDPTKAAGSKWQPDKEPSGGGSGGSLPANFPEEDAANANKFIGFDANGDYETKDAPSSLPAYSASNNGQLLGISEGSPTWVDAPSGGSDEPTVETLLTLTIPQMEASEEEGGGYNCDIAVSGLTEAQQAVVQSIDANEHVLYLNSEETPLPYHAAMQETPTWYGFNHDLESPVDPSSPFFVYAVAGENIVIMSDQDLSGETISLIGYAVPEVEGGQLVVRFADADFEHMTIGQANKTAAQIYAAIQAKQPVVASIPEWDMVLPMNFYIYASEQQYSFIFTTPSPANGAVSVTQITLESSETGTDNTSISITTAASPSDIPDEPLTVTMEYDNPSEPTALVSDKTFGEIVTAFEAGRVVVIKTESGNNCMTSSVVFAARSQQNDATAYSIKVFGPDAATYSGGASDHITASLN